MKSAILFITHGTAEFGYVERTASQSSNRGLCFQEGKIVFTHFTLNSLESQIAFHTLFSVNSYDQLDVEKLVSNSWRALNCQSVSMEAC